MKYIYYREGEEVPQVNKDDVAVPLCDKDFMIHEGMKEIINSIKKLREK